MERQLHMDKGITAAICLCARKEPSCGLLLRYRQELSTGKDRFAEILFDACAQQRFCNASTARHGRRVEAAD